MATLSRKFFQEHGKRGGQIGGRVRAARLTAAERQASATKASRAAAKARTAAAKARKAAAK